MNGVDYCFDNLKKKKQQPKNKTKHIFPFALGGDTKSK